MAELKPLQAKKLELESKQKAGDTTEATRTELDEVNGQIQALSEEIRGAITTPAATAPTEAVKPAIVKEVVKEVLDKVAEKVKAPKYVVKDNEKHLVHARLTKGNRFDPATGEQISNPFMQMFTEREFDQFKANANVLGYTFKVIHEPKK